MRFFKSIFSRQPFVDIFKLHFKRQSGAGECYGMERRVDVGLAAPHSFFPLAPPLGQGLTECPSAGTAQEDVLELATTWLLRSMSLWPLWMHMCSSRSPWFPPVAAPPGDLGWTLRRPWLLGPGACCCHLQGRGQGCGLTSYPPSPGPCHT